MGKARIFVADHDKSFLTLMEYLLEEEGYVVTLLDPTQDAYEQIAQSPPDLLILDIILGLPDAGWALLDRLAQSPETAHLPVIICTSDMQAVRARSEYIKTMKCPTLEKPFDMNAFLSTVREALATNIQPHDAISAELS